MKLLVFVLTFLSLSLSLRGEVNASQANIAFGLSTMSMNQIFNAVVVPVIDLTIAELGQQLPQDCCYHDSETLTRFYLQDLTIPRSSISTVGSLSSSDTGLFFNMFIKFDMTFFYHLCEEVGFDCTSIAFCKGNADLEINLNIKFEIIFNAGPQGHLILTFDDFDVHLGVPSKKGLCLLLSSLVDAAVPIVNALLDILLPKELESLLNTINGVNQTKPLPHLPFAISWSFTNDTGTSIDGVGLQLIVDILLKSNNYQAAPYLPSPPLPPVLTLMQQQQVFVDFSDSFLNNLIYALFSVHGLSLDTEADGWKISLDVTDTPNVFFVAPMSPDDAAKLVIKSKAVATQKPLRFVVQSITTIHFELIITPQGQLYLDLDPDEFDVHITSCSPPITNGTKHLIEKEIENAWASAIPGIDEKLKDHAIQLPHIASFSDPEIIYNQGYASFSVDTLPQGVVGGHDFLVDSLRQVTKEITQNVFLGAWEGERGEERRKGRNIACPQIDVLGFQEGC